MTSHCLTTWLRATLILVMFGPSCFAQSNQRNAPSDSLARILDEPTEVVAVPDKDGLQRALQELVQETEKLRGARTAPKAAPPGSNTSNLNSPFTNQANQTNQLSPGTPSLGETNWTTPPLGTREFAPSFPQGTGLTPDSGESVSQIRERIKLLKTLYQNQPAKALPAGSQGPATGPAAVPQPPSQTRRQPPFPLPTENRRSPPAPTHSIQRVGVTSASSYSPPNAIPEIKEVTETDTLQLSLEAERVLDDPVNAFELGNSLFQTGNLGAALKAFNAVDRDQITAFDQLWLDYATACCHRRLGDQSKAEALFRDLVNRNPQSLEPPVVQAKWWLNYLKNKKAYLESTARLDEEIKSLLEKAENSVDREPK